MPIPTDSASAKRQKEVAYAEAVGGECAEPPMELITINKKGAAEHYKGGGGRAHRKQLGQT
jgi:hypothetical protein